MTRFSAPSAEDRAMDDELGDAWCPRSKDLPLMLVHAALLSMGFAVALICWPCPATGYAVFWLPAGVATALLIAGSRRAWPIQLPVSLVGFSLAGLSLPGATIAALGSTLEALVACWLMTRYRPVSPDMKTSGDFSRLIGAAAIAALVGAVTGGSARLVDGSVAPVLCMQEWITWWAGHVLAITTVLPLILSWNSERSQREDVQRLALLGVLLLSSALFLFSLSSDGHNQSALLQFARPYMLIPIGVVIAAGFGRTGASLNALIVFTISLATHSHYGSLSASSTPFVDEMHWWTFSAMLLLTSLGLAVLLHERQLTIAALTESERLLSLSEAAFRSISQSPVTMIWVSGPDGLCYWFNDSWLLFTGRTMDAELGSGWTEGVHPDDLDFCLATYGAAFEAREPFEMEYRLRNARGEYRLITDSGAPRISDDGEFLGYVGVCRDITEDRANVERLRARERLIRAINDGSSVGIAVVNLKGLIIQANRRFEQMFGRSEEELRKLEYASLIHPDERHLAEAKLKALFSGEALETAVQRRYLRKDSSSFWGQFDGSMLTDDQGHLAGIVCTIADITDRKEAEERIRHLAQYDYLTQLPNRALMFDRLALVHAQAVRYSRCYAIIFIDLDNFKPVNDRLGHDAGDELLKLVAERLSKNIRASDTAARFGGDEFVVLATEVDTVEDVKALAGKLAEVLAQTYEIRREPITITPSIGIAVYPHHGAEPDAILTSADKAMYQVKGSGRNGIALSGDHEVRS